MVSLLVTEERYIQSHFFITKGHQDWSVTRVVGAFFCYVSDLLMHFFTGLALNWYAFLKNRNVPSLLATATFLFPKVAVERFNCILSICMFHLKVFIFKIKSKLRNIWFGFVGLIRHHFMKIDLSMAHVRLTEKFSTQRNSFSSWTNHQYSSIEAFYQFLINVRREFKST